MTEIVTAKVDGKLIQVLEDISSKFSKITKQKYSLDEVKTYGTFASSILANHYLKVSPIKFRIRKLKGNRGIITIENGTPINFC